MSGLIQRECNESERQPTTDVREFRKRIDLPADEVEQGDVIRDQGVFREVARVEVSVVERSLVFYFFDPAEGLSDRLTVPVLETVSVWRVCQ